MTVERSGRALPPGLGIAVPAAMILIAGGAGLAYPMLRAIVEQLAVVLLAVATFRHLARRPRVDPLEAAIVLLAVVIPAAHLVPLPFSSWASLPGRALPAAVLAAGGLDTGSRPLTLDPDGTIGAMLALIPGLALFAVGHALGAGARVTMMRGVIVVAALSACLGALQVVTGPDAPGFASAHAGQGIGLFVNRNHQAALLLVAICLVVPRGPAAAVERGWLAAALTALFAAGIVATTSRTGLALLPLCLLGAITRLPRTRWVAWAGAAVAIGLGVAVWLGGALSPTLARFGGAPDVRWTFWRTTWHGVQAFWPLGSGIGSFPEVYPLFEAHGDVTTFAVNHAHNDYLELLLEGGAAVAFALALFGWWLIGSWRRRATAMPGTLAALAVLLVFSLVEYPLRMLSLTAVFGLLCAMVRPSENGRRSGSIGWAAWSAAFVAAASLITASIAIWRVGAASAVDARARVARVPTDQHAVMALAVAAQTRGDGRGADRLLTVAGRLGWRDPDAQLMLLARDGAAGDAAGAASRADALLRMDARPALTIKAIRLAIADPAFRAAFAAALATDPPWRRTYLTDLRNLSAPLAAHAALLAALPSASFEERAAFIRRALALGDIATAAQTWRGAGSALPDPRFRRVDSDTAARSGLFGWHETDIDGVRVALGQDDAPTVLTVDGAASGLLLYQDLLLPPGDYRIVIPVEADRDTGDIGWSLTCAATGVRLDGIAPNHQPRNVVLATVPADCPVQRLGLRSAGTAAGFVDLRMGTGRLQAMPPLPGALNRN